MFVSIQSSLLRLLPLVVLSSLSLHCGQTPSPDGGTGGASAGTGGENPGGASSGGSDGMGGETGGTAPYDGPAVTKLTVSTIDKVDLLFVVDNSVSMADKQVIFVQAIPKLIERMVTPNCIDLESGERTPSENLECPLGTVREIDPIDDLHIGVITSSIGGFGSQNCTSGDNVDKALLLPKVRSGAPDPSGLGFLEWSGGGEAEVAALSADFTAHIDAVGETGCGFEAPLEAWYRFLIDPSPPADIVKVNNVATSTGVEATILEQRAEFLRPDSLVAVVMLTDEDDCSVMEGGGYYPNAGYGWLIPDIQRVFETASEACATNPNDACCYSCLQQAAPEGCTDTCVRDGNDNGVKLEPEDDRANMRCHSNQRRFGLDLLYPVSRYVDGLSKATIVDTQLTTDPEEPVLALNPLLFGAALDPDERGARPPNQVVLAGIVGVPWQDIATPATLDDPEALEYIDAKGLSEPDDALDGEDRWALILGTPNLPANSLECQGDDPPAACGQVPVPPLDPFMIASTEPRSGTNPITGDPIVGLLEDAWSPINGSEFDNSVDSVDGKPSNDDLQYACIFPLSEASLKVDCSPADSSCECGEEPTVPKSRPVCKPPGSEASTAATTSQYWAKAYPAQRLLSVLKGFGDNSVVASICPKVLHLPNSPYYGYTPALDAVVKRLAGTRGGLCLTPEISWDADDEEGPCVVVEATPTSLDCSREGRADLDDERLASARAYLEEEGVCGDDSIPCEDYGLCAITPVDDVEPCFDTTPADGQPAGFCLIDPALGPDAGGQGDGCSDDPATWDSCDNPNGALCPASEGRMIRFVGQNTPEKGSSVFRVCAVD